jgi:AcrR family transcriptional regulator
LWAALDLPSVPAVPGNDDAREGWLHVARKQTAVVPPETSRVASSIKDSAALIAGRERLLKGARKCFTSKGYGGTSVQDIAAAAGISIGSLYKYVRAKEDLLYLMAESSHASLREVVETAFTAVDDPIEGMRVVVDALVREADRDRDLINLLYAEFKYMPPDSKKLILEQERAIVDRLIDLIGVGNANGNFACSDPRIVAINIVMFGSTWVLKNHLVDLPLSTYIDEQVAAALRLVGARTPVVKPARRRAK